MLVYNENKDTILDDYDLEKGYLKNDTLEILHPAIEGVEELGHYETIKEYSNGGKDVKWVVDREGVKAEPAKIEKEPILIYVPYTQQDYYKQEYNELIKWFNETYTYKEQKYRRLYTLKLYDDNGLHPHDMLIELYKEAEAKRRRIQELEVLISE